MQIDITLMAFIVLACLVFVIVRQQRTIDTLTNKLLGIQPRSKKTEIVEEDASPKEDEPKGWHDH